MEKMIIDYDFDLIGLIQNGVLTEDAAEDLFSSLPFFDYEKLGMDRVERTAYAHGASLGDLAMWRDEGIPCVCIRCGISIYPPDFGWTLRHDGDDVLFIHIDCLED